MTKYISGELTAAFILEARAERSKQETEKRLKDQAKAVSAGIMKLRESNIETEFRIDDVLDPVIKSELNQLGFKVRQEKDGGPQGTGYTFTYVSLK